MAFRMVQRGLGARLDGITAPVIGCPQVWVSRRHINKARNCTYAAAGDEYSHGT